MSLPRLRLRWLWVVPLGLFGLAYLDRLESGPNGDWRSASREPVGLAPDPLTTQEPVVQVYGARAVRWRGYFGVHTWVAVKPRGAREYTIYEVNGWRLRRTGSAVSVSSRPPDSRWFGNRPLLIAERRGDGADEIIARIERAVADYPYADTYRVWPGPNSNTFVAHVLRAVPELRADLPATAIGKDYLGLRFVARSPSGTGVQFNAFGVLGAMAGLEEGVELNVLGLTFGVDPLDLALKLPLAGRVGWPVESVAVAEGRHVEAPAAQGLDAGGR
jgi:hypothetical protein